MAERHVQLPIKSGLTPDEKMVYVSIKRYMNEETKEAFPSISTIIKHTGYSKPYIIKLIHSLEEKGYVKVNKREGQSTIYIFNDIKTFKPLSYDFLDNPKLNKDEKKTVACETEFMYVTDNKGAISMTDNQISLATGLDRRLLKRTHDSLEEKGMMHSLNLKLRDPETGLAKITRIYELDALGQAVLYTLQNHENRLENVEDRMTLLEKELFSMKQENAKLKFELEQRKKEIIIS